MTLRSTSTMLKKVYMVVSPDHLEAYKYKKDALFRIKKILNEYYDYFIFKKEVVSKTRIDWISSDDDMISLYTLEVN